jgi:hypothetical protein
LARPSAEVLLERDIDSIHSIQVLKGQQLWTLVYQGEPVNLRKTLWNVEGKTMFKYARTAFTTEAPAKNLAERLNRWFKTTEFQAQRVI